MVVEYEFSGNAFNGACCHRCHIHDQEKGNVQMLMMRLHVVYRVALQMVREMRRLAKSSREVSGIRLVTDKAYIRR